MEVNITLFVQMINFFVAWFLLRTFYFSPAIAVLDRDQHKKNVIINMKHKWQNYVSAKQQEIDYRWHALKHIAKKNRPDIMHPDFFIFKNITPQSDALADIGHQERDHLIDQVADSIAQEVAHVD